MGLNITRQSTYGNITCLTSFLKDFVGMSCGTGKKGHLTHQWWLYQGSQCKQVSLSQSTLMLRYTNCVWRDTRVCTVPVHRKLYKMVKAKMLKQDTTINTKRYTLLLNHIDINEASNNTAHRFTEVQIVVASLKCHFIIEGFSKRVNKKRTQSPILLFCVAFHFATGTFAAVATMGLNRRLQSSSRWSIWQQGRGSVSEWLHIKCLFLWLEIHHLVWQQQPLNLEWTTNKLY